MKKIILSLVLAVSATLSIQAQASLNYPIVIYPRDGYPIDEASLPPNVRLVNTRLYNMSSTLIRQLIADGRGVRRYLHPDVISYIESNHLYK